MIDLAYLRDNKEQVIALILKKDPSFKVKQLIDADSQMRHVRQQVEDLRHKKNELASQAKSGITPEIRAQSIEISKGTIDNYLLKYNFNPAQNI
mgnify:CR=1 FL=1